ncbi:MAG: type I restriction enzyme HsdR N-terminal domain-containing protein [Bacteroidetes bacterium]|nr:type I restriction enzyme HsdR N-terminal domain-containing protein [Bacteroidota bacterium]MBL0066907.1 type I restriction enzyme HsdR N-terminal domain-containing protein [Bacteroidota bacterium]MBL0140187.1 type I restriction enzyme HsdR N-terminal domain-containing protein [Bacteroidota bacterium]
MELPKLHFPEYKFKLRSDTSGGQSLKIFDIVRGKYVRLSPEEWVRQHILHFLILDKHYPKSLTGVEKRVVVNRLERRYDILIHDSDMKPMLLVECKAPNVKITQEVFDQAARYNLTVDARIFILTNGYETFCCTLDHANKSYHFLEEVPFYEKL